MIIKKKLLFNLILILILFFFPLISALTINETHLTTTGTLYDIYVNGSITIDNLTITNTTISIYNLNVTGNFTSINNSQLIVYNLTAAAPYNDVKYDNGTIVGFENMGGDSYTIIMNANQYFQVGNFYTPSTDSSEGSDGSSGGSGGAPSVSGATYIPNQEEINVGYTKQLAVKDKIRINISNELHLVQVTGISSPIVTINVSSTPQTANINIGGTRKFELTGDNLYDISITLNKIVLVNNVYKADLTVESDSTHIPAAQQDDSITGEIINKQENEEIIPKPEKANIVDYKKILYPLIIFIIIVSVIYAIFFIVSTKKFRRKHHYINYYSPQT